jgi:putative PIN family toxin of toxin-antitoxin system
MAASQPFSAVLDTNVVLAWLVFRDARVAALAQALESGAIRWMACPRMREELGRALAYPALERWLPDSERTLATFDSRAVINPDPPPRQAGPLLCSDPDDQVFIELALATQAAWLFTRDRALLKLKRRAASRNLQIAPPEAWPGVLSSA